MNLRGIKIVIENLGLKRASVTTFEEVEFLKNCKIIFLVQKLIFILYKKLPKNYHSKYSHKRHK